MTKKIALYILLQLSFFGFSQKSNEQFPIFPSCENKQPAELEQCFYNEIQTFVFNNFEVSNSLPNDYKGIITTIFEVTDKGNFKIIYIDSNQKLLKEETQRVFNLLPSIKPATYNDRAIYSKYTIKIAIPLQNPAKKKRNRHSCKKQIIFF